MDDTQKSQNGNSSVVDSVGSSLAQVAPVIPVGGVGKEIERPVTDFVKPSEAPPIIDSEVREAGVDAINEKATLDAVHAQIGVKPSGENTEINPVAHKVVNFPLTDSEIEGIQKDKDTQASAYWLSVLIGKIKKVLLISKD